ncbi:MAG TPA: DUF58 domain-containing protein [Chloroflexota bacterium]|nr:DUF58 domain-containing protein [Chloroflexota bacterium]
MSGFKLLLLAVVVGGLAVMSGQVILFHLTDVLVATVLLAGVWSVVSVRGLRVERTIRNDRASVGEEIEQRLEIRATLPIPRVWLEAIDGGTMPGYRPGRVLDLGIRGRRVWEVSAPCLRRGVYDLGPLRIAGTDPFGLFRFGRRFGPSRRVLIYPETFDLTGMVLPAGNLFGGDKRKSGWHQTTPFVAGVRDYHAGDPVRHVHWPSSAKAGHLMVKEFDAEPVADVWLVLDLEARAQRGQGDESTEEYGVKIAASLARYYVTQGRAVGLVAISAQRLTIQPDRGQRQLTKLLEHLAVVHATGAQPIAEVLATESDRCSRNAAILVITPSLDERWPAVMRQLRDRGIHGGGVVLEASTFGEATSSLLLVGILASAAIPSILVKRGDNIGKVLTEGSLRVVRGWR